MLAAVLCMYIAVCHGMALDADLSLVVEGSQGWPQRCLFSRCRERGVGLVCVRGCVTAYLLHRLVGGSAVPKEAVYMSRMVEWMRASRTNP